VARVIVVANFLIQNAIGMAVMAVAFGVAVPQTGAGLRAAQGDLVKAVTVAGLPLGVVAMGLLLAGMLPTSVLRGVVVAVLYNAIGFVMSAALLSFMGLLGVPFAVGLIKSLQPVAQ
jgi:predicted permease